ncbi:MAG: cytochrome D ubiquinol oxidase subunit II, partial [Alphaproteobacteria bacterium]|nr:cytochrome D ubiquinol oxidase subunit II [Alphaproteobacteria bacterium]
MVKSNEPISDKKPIPPADPVNRREPLPSQVPKPPAEDPDAPARIKAILQNPGYRRADMDLDFLGSPRLRGVRLEIDYLKPELLLEKHNVRHTIVVFGSTRICEPVAAKRKVDGLKASLARDPANKDWAHRLAVAERVLAKSKYYDVSRDFGRLVGTANQTDKGPHCTI